MAAAGAVFYIPALCRRLIHGDSHMSKQDRSSQKQDKPQDKQQDMSRDQVSQQKAPSAASGKEPQQTGHQQSGGFAGWEKDHKKDLKQ
jgi:hypothetical protein